MLGTLPKADICARVKAVNLTPNRFAKRCGLAASTLARGLGSTRSYNRVIVELESEELRLLRHLSGLHPQEAIEAATVALCPARSQPQPEAIPA